MRRNYNFSIVDGLLTYLALYPGERLPGVINTTIQQPAFERWSTAFDSQSFELASWMRDANASTAFTPGLIYGKSRTLCMDAFCAALVMHNTFRVLGRHATYVSHGTNYLPLWWQRDVAGWEAASTRLQTRMMSLRRNESGERWGPLYHTAGLIAYGIHESALLGEQTAEIITEIVARLNSVVPPGEDPVKQQIDRDAAQMAALFVAGKTVDGPPSAWARACGEREGYVLPELSTAGSANR